MPITLGKELAKLVELPEGKTLKDLLESDDSTELKLNPEIVFRTKADEETFTANIKADAKTAGEEMAVKEIKRANELEFEGKTVEKLFGHFSTTQQSAIDKALLDAGKEPDSKIKELQGEKAALITRAESAEGETLKLTNDFNKHKNELKLDSEIVKGFGGVKFKAPQDVVLSTFKNKFTTEINAEGVTVVKKGGVVLKDQNQSPRTIESVTKEFVEDEANKWMLPTVEGGSGEGDDGGGGDTQFDAFLAEMKTKGIKEGTPDFNNEMQKRISAKTLVI